MTRKKITVLDWLGTIGYASDPIKISVRYGSTVVCSGESAKWLETHFPPAALGAMEARVQYVQITRDEIIIYAKPKAVII